MLTLLIVLPVIGALLMPLLPERASRPLALITSGLTFVLSLWMLTRFDVQQPVLQFREFVPWLPPLGLNYSLGVDGLSLPLIVLGTFLTLVVVFTGEKSAHRLFYALVLLASAGISGALAAQNLLLFILFYEVELAPFYLLILIWGGQRREQAAVKFLLYTAVSGILVLAAFLAMGWLTHAPSFEYQDIRTAGLAPTTQALLLLLLVLGFGIKMPLVPLHSWLPDAYVEASTPTAILLGGVLAKLGTYGLVRFALGCFPQAWGQFSGLLALVAAIGIAYGALAAIAQKDIKRMVAYSSVGHMSYVLLAAAAHTHLSMVGAIAQMISHGLILALLFYLVGVIETKVGTRELDVLNGLLNPLRGLPTTSALLILGGMASAGIPGLMGFVAEFLIFQGSYRIFPLPTLIAVVGTGLTAVYFVIMINRTCFGRLDNATAYYPRVLWWETMPALVLTLLILFLGVQPTWLVRWSETTSAQIVAAIPEATEIVASLANS
ncbi:MAG: NAD(P)H-quinone oxidoreductase subunit D4 [Thermosynechococcus sp.]|uniref:NADH-quinone oxidoreductase subunit M n=1 Tax=Thermosynechococcus sp. TaxID=2814275 RepID=UPI00220D2882|nr:NADH-quinone oxidoreductase subunit M [Thermosynechococcus sp.]BCX12890.1 MAG: NAD(P)H-quinone oxidoreductase subunit D4 [Thermosynechococcus sp.]